MKEIRGNKFKLPNQKEVELFLKLEQVLLSRDHVKEMCTVYITDGYVMDPSGCYRISTNFLLLFTGI